MATILPQTVKEAAWNQKQAFFSAATQARLEAERLSDIAVHFHISRDEQNTLFDAYGVPAQLAMSLTEKVSGVTRTVICKAVDGEWFWFVENMAGSQVEASDLIACVRIRIGARLASQLTGKVTVN